jgi:hypothetical protein
VKAKAGLLDHWTRQVPLLPGDRLRDLLDRPDGVDEEED